MKKKFNYVYITVNKINGKGYVGSHGTNKEKDNYIGSGLIFLNAIKKYGKTNFIKVKLKYFQTILEARQAEEHYIKLFDTLSPNGYNMSITGGQGEWGGKLSEEYKNKISISMIGKNKGNIPWNKGIKMSKEFCDKTSKGINEKRQHNENYIKRERRGRQLVSKNSKSGVHTSLTQEHKNAISAGLKKYKKTELHKQHISQSMKGKPKSDETKQKMKKPKIKRIKFL